VVLPAKEIEYKNVWGVKTNQNSFEVICYLLSVICYLLSVIGYYLFITVFKRKNIVTPQDATQKTIEKTVEKIIRLIKENPMITIQELSKETKLSNQGVIWNLTKLKKKNTIKLIGPDKGGHWEVVEK